MTAHNADVAAVFNRLADLLEIEEANPFRVRAYRRAAATVEDLGESVATLVAEGKDLRDLPGIGEDLAAKIAEIVKTGRLKLLDEVNRRTPSALAELMSVPGLGPKRVKLLHERLGISTLPELATAARAGRLRTLPRFSAAQEAKILAAVQTVNPATARFKISTAEDFARGLEAYLERLDGMVQVTTAGSYRRRRETVGDLDIVATCDDASAAMDWFVAYDEIAKVLAKGPTRASVVLKAGLQVDLRVVKPDSYGAALHYFTGSKAHNIAVRQLGQERGLKINEYGVFRGGKRLGGRTEREVYAAIDLPYIEPELRENRGEIEAAQSGRLPNLVRLEDIRGDLHVHTRASDGKSTLEEMVEAARSRGYAYLAVTDHSQHATVAHGLDPERLSAQLDAIDRVNDRLSDLVVLKSCEVDILPDGKLDLPDSVLARLDLVVGAVHSRFDLPSEAQTTRILKAMDNHRFHVLAHPSGRLIGERPAYAVDMERVIEGARERGCFLELNAHPSRLDLDDVHCRAAKDLGIKVAIGTDAHSDVGLGAMRWGIGQARRGWLERDDVLNTRPLRELRRLLRR